MVVSLIKLLGFCYESGAFFVFVHGTNDKSPFTFRGDHKNVTLHLVAIMSLETHQNVYKKRKCTQLPPSPTPHLPPPQKMERHKPM
jgi:hypothetical protein